MASAATATSAAADFRERLERDRPDTLEWDEEVRLADAAFSRALAVTGVRFKSGFDGDSASFTSLAFAGCAFEGGLRMRNCRVRGDLSFADCWFGPGADGTAALDLRGARVEGDVELANSHAEGHCSLDRLVVRGDLLLRGLKAASLSLVNAAITGEMLAEPSAGGGVLGDGQGVEIEGRLEASGASCHALVMTSVAVRGDCDFTGLRVTADVTLARIAIGGRLTLLHLECGEVVRIHDGSRVKDVTTFAGARIRSQLDLSGCEFGEIIFNGTILGSLWIGSRQAVTCTGIYATDSEVRTYTRLSRLLARDPLEAHRTPGRRAGRARRLHLEEVGTIAFRNCRFGSLFSTWIIKRYDDEEEDGWQTDNRVVAENAFLFTDCSVQGELTLTRLCVGPEEARQMERQRLDDGATDPSSSASPIAPPDAPAGDTSTPETPPPHDSEEEIPTGGMDGPEAVPDPASLPVVARWGSVRLDRTKVGGAFLILSSLSVAHRFELSTLARQKAMGQAQGRGAMASELRAHMRSLSMREFEASYVDLSGLTLHACGKDDPDGPIDGCLVGDRLYVKSCVSTYAWTAEACAGGARRAYIEVPGAMRLRGARIGELRLAAESFGTALGCKAWNDGVVLELAEIRQLRVPPRPAASGSHLNGFPVPLDLSGLAVSHWNFTEDVHAEGSAEAGHYLDFLDNDEKLHREVYKSVAQSLRNVGRDDDAESILYTEEYRARWERRHGGAADRRWPPYAEAGRRGGEGRRPMRDRLWDMVRHPFEWADRFLLGYRRNPIRLLYLILILFAVSTVFVSSRPANFELSDRWRLILQNDDPEDRVFSAGIEPHRSGDNLGPGEHWGLWNAIWMSARYHVPIVPLAFQDEYVASNDNRLDVGLPLFLERAHWRDAGTDRGDIWFTAEDWFGLMSILNWIMWPLLLTFALRRALRAE